MIDGVMIKKLKVIADERGRLMEILRADDEMFTGFGQVYMTTAYPGVVKGWHYHKTAVRQHGGRPGDDEDRPVRRPGRIEDHGRGQ